MYQIQWLRLPPARISDSAAAKPPWASAWAWRKRSRVSMGPILSRGPLVCWRGAFGLDDAQDGPRIDAAPEADEVHAGRQVLLGAVAVVVETEDEVVQARRAQAGELSLDVGGRP